MPELTPRRLRQGPARAEYTQELLFLTKKETPFVREKVFRSAKPARAAPVFFDPALPPPKAALAQAAHHRVDNWVQSLLKWVYETYLVIEGLILPSNNIAQSWLMRVERYEQTS